MCICFVCRCVHVWVLYMCVWCVLLCAQTSIPSHGYSWRVEAWGSVCSSQMVPLFCFDMLWVSVRTHLCNCFLSPLAFTCHTWKPGPSCFIFVCVGITIVCHHAWLHLFFLLLQTCAVNPIMPVSICLYLRTWRLAEDHDLQPATPWWFTDVEWHPVAALCMISRPGFWPDLGNAFCCESISGSCQLIFVLNLATLTQICLLNVEVHGDGGNWLGILQLPDHLISGGLNRSTANLFITHIWLLWRQSLFSSSAPYLEGLNTTCLFNAHFPLRGPSTLECT